MDDQETGKVHQGTAETPQSIRRSNDERFRRYDDAHVRIAILIDLWNIGLANDDWMASLAREYGADEETGPDYMEWVTPLKQQLGSMRDDIDQMLAVLSDPRARGRADETFPRVGQAPQGAHVDGSSIALGEPGPSTGHNAGSGPPTSRHREGRNP